MKTRIPAKPNPSHAKALKTLHQHYRKGGGELGLKQFVKTSENEDIQLLGADWFHNKTANFSKPPLGIGSTRKKKIKQKQTAAKATMHE